MIKYLTLTGESTFLDKAVCDWSIWVAFCTTTNQSLEKSDLHCT